MAKIFASRPIRVIRGKEEVNGPRKQMGRGSLRNEVVSS